MLEFNVIILTDEHHCFDCGTMWASGYDIVCRKNGQQVAELTRSPSAACYDGENYEVEDMKEDIYKMALEHGSIYEPDSVNGSYEDRGNFVNEILPRREHLDHDQERLTE